MARLAQRGLVGQRLLHALARAAKGASGRGALRFGNLPHAPLVLNVLQRVLHHHLLVRILERGDLLTRKGRKAEVRKLLLTSLIQRVEPGELASRQRCCNATRLLQVLQIGLFNFRVDLGSGGLRAAAASRHFECSSDLDSCRSFGKTAIRV